LVVLVSWWQVTVGVGGVRGRATVAWLVMVDAGEGQWWRSS
jgi:hypothetical protein